MPCLVGRQIFSPSLSLSLSLSHTNTHIATYKHHNLVISIIHTVSAMAETYPEKLLDIFQYPARIIVAGYSNSGKSELVHKLIVKYHEKFKKIVICGLTSHPLERDEEIGPKIVVSSEIIDPVASEDIFDERGTLYILDDNFIDAVKHTLVVNAFTRGRHNKISCIFITQNLYMGGKHARNISLNCSHFILLRQRDLSQIHCLGRQIYGKEKAKVFVDIYKFAVYSRPYGYLLVDLGINTPESVQFRSNIVGEPPGERVFHW